MPFTTFFDDTVPDRWGVLSYLNACHQQSLQKKTKFDFSSAIDSYLESLRAIIKNKSESAKVNRAQTLFNRYYEKGRSSDRACAHEWKRKRRDADSRAGRAKTTLPKKHSQQKRRTGPPTIIYNNHGMTVNGSVYHSSLTSVPQPNDFPNDPSPSDPGTPDNRQSEDIEEEGDEDLWEKEDDTVVSDDLRESIHEDAEEEALPPSIEFLANLERTSREFKHKSKLSDGKYLEDILVAYAKTLKHIDVAHWLIIDPTDRNLETLLSSNGWDGITEGQSFMLPQLPEALSEHISKYAGITDRTACRALASSTDKEWESRVCDADHLFLKRWIDDASDHVISLITESNDLLNVKKPLQEGAWEGLYYPILDKCFTNLGELMLQRRDIALLAHENDANPVLNYSIRHDGVLHTRDVLLRPGRRLEFAIVEISKKFDGYKSTKWNGDLTKLYAGCIAILRDLKKAVNYHPPTVAKLAAAGVLQAGPMTMVLILSCIGPNLYYLRRGDPRVLPCEVQQFSTLGDVLTVVWKVRETARLSYQAVKDYLNKIESSTRILDRTDARFL